MIPDGAQEMKLTPEQQAEYYALNHGLDKASFPFSLLSIDELETEINRPNIFKTALHTLTKKVKLVSSFLFQ